MDDYDFAARMRERRDTAPLGWPIDRWVEEMIERGRSYVPDWRDDLARVLQGSLSHFLALLEGEGAPRPDLWDFNGHGDVVVVWAFPGRRVDHATLVWKNYGYGSMELYTRDARLTQPVSRLRFPKERFTCSDLNLLEYVAREVASDPAMKAVADERALCKEGTGGT